MAKKNKKATSPQGDQSTSKPPGKSVWKLMDKGSSIAAGMLAQRASTITWRAVTGKKPPTSGQHPEVSTKEAVAWAVIGGAVVELVKVGVRRGAATYWVKSTGSLPPGMKPVAGKAKEPAPEGPAPHEATTASKKISRRNRGK